MINDEPEYETLDCIVVGAGFAGMYAVHRLRSANMSVVGFDDAHDVGGVWYWNRYPGAVCDVDSRDYSYSFSKEIQQEWTWSVRNAGQPEILAYANFVADKLDLRRSFRFNSHIASAVYLDASKLWEVTTSEGTVSRARFLIMATGPLSAPRHPDIPGLDTFGGNIYHTAKWPHEGVDFTGRKVAVVGTGASGIQITPHVARQAKHLYVFQRTPQYALPIQNFARPAHAETAFKAGYEHYREYLRGTFSGYHVDIEPLPSAKAADPEEREFLFEVSWGRGLNALMRSYSDLLTDPESNELAGEFVRRKIGSIVKDPKTAAALTPVSYPIGSKRLPLEAGYWRTFNRENVSLVDLQQAPFKRATPTTIETEDASYEVDDIVFATGFDALTGALLSIDIRGTGGLSLRDKWADGARSYLGLMLAGFPNLFTVSGPGSPSVLANLIMHSEFHVNWIVDCLSYMREHGVSTIQPSIEQEAEWTRHVAEASDATVLSRANSWWVGANVPGKPRVFLAYAGGFPKYMALCNEIAESGYDTFLKAA